MPAALRAAGDGTDGARAATPPNAIGGGAAPQPNAFGRGAAPSPTVLLGFRRLSAQFLFLVVRQLAGPF